MWVKTIMLRCTILKTLLTDHQSMNKFINKQLLCMQ